MTRWQTIALFAIVGIILAGAYFWPVAAQDIPPCVDADAFVAELVKDGAREGPSSEQESRHADKVRLVEFKGVLWALLTNRGCLVVKPIPLDYAKDRGHPS